MENTLDHGALKVAPERGTLKRVQVLCSCGHWTIAPFDFNENLLPCTCKQCNNDIDINRYNNETK